MEKHIKAFSFYFLREELNDPIFSLLTGYTGFSTSSSRHFEGKMQRNKPWTHLDFFLKKTVVLLNPRGRYWNSMFLSQALCHRNPSCSPHKLMLYHMWAMWRKFLPRPPQYWVHTDGAHPAQTNLSVREDQWLRGKPFIRWGGSCTGLECLEGYGKLISQ